MKLILEERYKKYDEQEKREEKEFFMTNTPQNSPAGQRRVYIERAPKYVVVDAADLTADNSMTLTPVIVSAETTEAQLRSIFASDAILELNLLEYDEVHKALAKASGVIVDTAHVPTAKNMHYGIALIGQGGKLINTANAMSKPLITPHSKFFPYLSGPMYKTLEERAKFVSDFVSTIPKPVHPPYIVLEGPDGCGKGVQADLLCAYLQKKGYSVLHIREPGKEIGTASVEEKIRTIILDEHNHMSHITELMLYQAARAELVVRTFVDEKVDAVSLVRSLAPLQKTQGFIIVSERNYWSSITYQGFGLKISKTLIDELSANAMRGIIPDLGFVINVSPSVGFARMNAESRQKDRLEKRSTLFHDRVHKGYFPVARREPHAILLEGNQPKEVIHDEIVKKFEEHIEPLLRDLPPNVDVPNVLPNEEGPHTVSPSVR